MNKILVTILTLCAIIILPVWGAQPDIKFKHIGLQEGLSHATVQGIARDDAGFMWIATPDGLNRFDGSTFRVFRHSDDNPGSPADNSVRSVRTDKTGRVWSAGANAISMYDRRSESFRNYALPGQIRAEIIDLMPVGTEVVLVGTTAGVYRFDVARGTYEHLPGGFPANLNVASMARANGIIFICSSDGLYSYDQHDGKVKRIRVPGDVLVNAVLSDGPGHLLLGTEGAGLLRYNTSDGSHTAWRADGPEGLGSDYVRSIAYDRDGRLWVGTFNGLSVLDPGGRRFRHYDPSPDGSQGLSHSSVRVIYPDAEGGMWLGTYFGGLNYYHPLNNQFHTLRASLLRSSLNDNIISAMAEDAAGRLWIGTNNGGLNRYNPSDGTFAHYTAADGLGSNDVKAIYIDEGAGRIYVGTHIGGMVALNASTGAVTRLPGVPENVFSILPSRIPGRLWLATLADVVLYDPATGVSEPVKGVTPSKVTDLYRDADGHVWVYGEDGIQVFDEKRPGVLTAAGGVFARVPGVGTGVYDVCRSNDGHIYYISTGRGLWAFDPKDGKTRHYTTAQGLPNDIVYATMEDNNGNLWCSTNGGLARINPATGDIRTYSARDGLQSNQFMPKSFLRASDGRFYFGGVNGLSWFNPAVFESNPYAPAPVISGLRLFNRDVTPGDDTGLLERAIGETERLSFGVDQTVFTIDFTVCNYVAGGHNTFAYKLDGLDKDWTYTDGAGSVTYSNLPAGDYRFMLRAANNDGVWCETVTTLDISVAQVWYKRWWAITLFVLSGLGLAGGVWWYLLHKRLLEEQLRAERLDRDRQRELNEMKVRFFINMSHELRTPLTLIQLPVEEMLAHPQDPKTQRQLTTIQNNANRILHIVNQVLDYRRAELGMFRLQVRPVNVNELARKIYANYDYQARRRGVVYSIETTVPDTPMLIDPEYLELILNNLLSNAFKYTPRGQSITVGLTVDASGRNLRVTVEDTGCGIPADKLPDIFTRFYQVNERAGGSGIGLSLVKRLVELHHGTVVVESELGRGTRFTVEIPVDDASYTADEHAAPESAAEPATAPAPVPLPLVDGPDDGDALPDAETDDTGDDGDDKRPAVLAVDDNPDILKYICGSLGETYNVIPAADGAKALQILATRRVDLILTDVMMPDIDGMQLCRTVKRNLRTSHIPVIILSAKSDADDQMEGLRVGADDYIAKPFSMPMLAAKIKNLLRTRAQAVRHFTDSAEVEPEKAALNPLDEAFLKKAMQVMADHLDDSQFSTDAFAREMCMSRSNLHLKMRALTGESTNDFIRRYRLRRAMELLKTGRYTVSEVSGMVGYGTPSYFATSFKKFFGSLPSDYVKKD